MYLILLLFLTGCVSYQERVETIKNLIRTDQRDRADKILYELSEQNSKDQIMNRLNYATELQSIGNYSESIKYFHLVESQIEVNDYLSLSDEAFKKLISEDLGTYRTKSFEQLLVLTNLTINYLALNNFPEALVEAKKIDLLSHRLKQFDNKIYLAYANYIAAIAYEANHLYEDAYIAYKMAYDNHYDSTYISTDLIRTARLSHNYQDYYEYLEKFDTEDDQKWLRSDLNEIVLIYQQGWISGLYEDHRNHHPVLYPTHSSTVAATLEINDQTLSTSSIYSIDRIASDDLNNRLDQIRADRDVASVSKATLSGLVFSQNPNLGLVTLGFLLSLDSPDTRQWAFLPESVQIIRAWLPKKQYHATIQGKLRSGKNSSEKSEQLIDNRKNRTILTWRSVK